MQIILVHPRLKQARTLTLGWKHLAASVAIVFAGLLLGSSALSYAAFKLGALLELPMLRSIVQTATIEVRDQRDGQMRDHLNAMALKLGEMQAQISRLNVVGERVSGLVGFKPNEFGFQTPGRGGPVTSMRDTSVGELDRMLDAFALDVERKAVDMNRLETALLDRSVSKLLAPSAQPVSDGFVGSGFGWRIDPFNGKQARHDGLDFAAPVGTPILAAAGGVVIRAEFHPEYGHVVDIDHGGDLVTRYAHCSRFSVKVGDIVKRGQHIADVGNSGRSTGSHLHFEVHVAGTPKDPAKYLAGGEFQATKTALR